MMVLGMKRKEESTLSGRMKQGQIHCRENSGDAATTEDVNGSILFVCLQQGRQLEGNSSV